jgi:ABC-type Fe3+ transport system substrate-binding protein
MTAGWGTVVVLNRAPHPNAAKVYLNWLLSRKGQMAWQKFAGAASLRTDISREGVRSWNLPIEGKDYFFVSLEKYATIETRKIRKIIGKAVEGRGK